MTGVLVCLQTNRARLHDHVYIALSVYNPAHSSVTEQADVYRELEPCILAPFVAQRVNSDRRLLAVCVTQRRSLPSLLLIWSRLFSVNEFFLRRTGTVYF